MMKEQVLTLIKMELRNYDQFMHKKRLKYYSWARGTVSLMSFASNVLPVLKNVQVALTDTDKGSHKAKQKELRHMETEQVCELVLYFYMYICLFLCSVML